MTDVFEWGPETEVVIYGAAALGTLVCRNIRAISRVVAFFDKRGDELETCMGVPVHSLEQAPFSADRRKRLVVFIAIKNIFEHEYLVNRLIELGYERIVFKAADRSVFDKRGMEGLEAIAETFDQAVAGSLTLPRQVPVSRLSFRVEWRDYASIRTAAGRVLAHIPVSDIATNLYGDASYAWENVPIAAMFPHLEFFEYLGGDAKASPDFYIEDFIVYTARRNGDYATTERWKENVIQNRAMVHEQMSLAWELDREFFTRNAPEAVWNPRGHFNLTSGKHRATFLVSKGCKFIVLSMSEDDYEEYLNRSTLEAAIRFVEDHGARPLPAPVLHPFFYRYPCAGAESFHGLLARLLRIMGKEVFQRHGTVNFRRLRINDASRDWAELGLRFAKLGAQVVRTTELSYWERLQASLYRVELSSLERAPLHTCPDLTILDDPQMLGGAYSGRCLLILDEKDMEKCTLLHRQVLMSFFQDGRKRLAVLTGSGE
ncbi:conserved hypothetical protein [Pseudomonas sp. 8Z]|uniref:hypothetical protein n=1 Tax=Pseudomonas sp. 8Z TaxID=2653166 RepID=UPI0012EF3ACE|nr:hypothetical protein [Pseudomonas sp. 8Z]VXC32238.1 conserved hypothetical protein [Pseudomonas sp. 8Z]